MDALKVGAAGAGITGLLASKEQQEGEPEGFCSKTTTSKRAT